jgi:hypothetical protein
MALAAEAPQARSWVLASGLGGHLPSLLCAALATLLRLAADGSLSIHVT